MEKCIRCVRIKSFGTNVRSQIVNQVLQRKPNWKNICGFIIMILMSVSTAPIDMKIKTITKGIWRCILVSKITNVISVTRNSGKGIFTLYFSSKNFVLKHDKREEPFSGRKMSLIGTLQNMKALFTTAWSAMTTTLHIDQQFCFTWEKNMEMSLEKM